ncbi:MAG: Maf family protein [Burkholderiales bacterium]
MTQLERSIYLASRSPRRRELLAQIGVRFQLLLIRAQPEADAELDEAVHRGEAPVAYVERVSRAKAEAGWRRVQQRNLPRAPVLAADTAVAVDGRILGKPSGREDAAEMLAALSGRRHDVFTAVALKYEDRIERALSATEVQFRALNPDDIRRYLATGEADDKAGAYAIQGRAAQFVSELRGSYTGVMGLPLYETARLIERMDSRHERRDPR